MDRPEPRMQTNSLNTDAEISAARRLLDGGGNFLKNSKNTLSKAAALTVMTLTLVGCGANANAEPTAPPAPTTSVDETPQATETPVETETPIETEAPTGSDVLNDPAITPETQAQRLSELQFSSEMTPEEMGEHYTEVLNSWIMAGATHDQWSAWLEAMNATEQEVAAEIAAGNRETYATALFGEDYANSESLKVLNFVDNLQGINESNVIRYLITNGDDQYPNPNPDNVEAWHIENINRGVTVEEQTDTTLTIVVRQEADANAAMTMFDDTDGDTDGHISDTHLEFDTSTGTPFITGISITDVN